MYTLKFAYIDYFCLRYILIENKRHYFLLDVSEFFGLVQDRSIKIKLSNDDKILVKADSHECYVITPKGFYNLIYKYNFRLIKDFLKHTNYNKDQLYRMFYPK